jgi:ferredoxin
MPTIKFVNEKKEVQVAEGSNLRKEALAAGVGLYPGIHKFLNCHGLAQCASCGVLVTKGMENTNPMGLMERLRLKFSMAYIGHESTMRLACQTAVNGDIEVQTKPAMNLFGENFYS